jgi:hypothetical protein
MRKAVWSGVLAAFGVLMVTTSAFAQAATASGTVTVNANINPKAKLTLGAAAISFPDLDPDAAPSLAATAALTIDVKARTAANATVSLTVQSGDDLKSGTDTIGIDKLTWTGSGTGFAGAGTSNKTTAQTVVSFQNSGTTTGTQSYALANSWTYATGSYSATLTYTLTAP